LRKRALRRTIVTDGSRREFSAEHSWHVALVAPLDALEAKPAIPEPPPPTGRNSRSAFPLHPRRVSSHLRQ
jgi:hypothetical protein